MFSSAILTLVLTVAPLISAQSTDVAAIEAHFTQSGIVPDLLSSFDPSALLSVDYTGVGAITPGQALSQTQVASSPSISVTAANSTVQFAGNYTLAMVDADAVGTDDSTVTRHWLVNGVTISDNKIANDSAIAITEYAGPAPPAGSGPHRYVIILLAQPTTFSPPSEFSTANIGVSKFDFNAYVKDSGLGAIVGATYYTVEEGTATASISATSAVVTSTLATSAAETGSDASTKTGTTASATGSNAAQESTASNAASKMQSTFFGLAMAVVIGAVVA